VPRRPSMLIQRLRYPQQLRSLRPLLVDIQRHRLERRVVLVRQRAVALAVVDIKIKSERY